MKFSDEPRVDIGRALVKNGITGCGWYDWAHLKGDVYVVRALTSGGVITNTYVVNVEEKTVEKGP